MMVVRGVPIRVHIKLIEKSLSTPRSTRTLILPMIETLYISF